MMAATEMTIAKVQADWPTDVLGTERHPLKPDGFKPRQTGHGKTNHWGSESLNGGSLNPAQSNKHVAP